jgi:DNA-binding transcriptional LysR family regulator
MKQRAAVERLDPRLLDLFMELHRTRNISRAAEAIGISQSGASTALNRLRRHFEDPVFISTGHGMEPTALGESLRSPIEAALRSLDSLKLVKPFDPLTGEDELRLVCGDIMERAVLCLVQPVLTQRAPYARLTSCNQRRDQLEAALADGTIDLAVGYFPELQSANIMQTQLGLITFGAYVRPEHPLAGQHVDMEAYCSARHVAISAECNICEIAEDFFRRSKIERNVQVRATSFECVPLLMRNADLIVTLPTDSRGRWHYGGDAVRLDLPFEMPTVMNRIYWHRRMHYDVRHRWWRALVAEMIRKVDFEGEEIPY